MPMRPPTHKPIRLGHNNAEGRPSARKRGYNARWEKFRAWFLQMNPLCVACERQGKVTAATDCDHVTPVTGPDDPTFYTGPHAALCHACHSAKTEAERGGRGKR